MVPFPRLLSTIILLTLTVLFGCSSSGSIQNSNSTPPASVQPPEKLLTAMRAVEPFFKPMGKPAAYDWLGSHYEPGQTFEDYLNQDPTLPTPERRKIYVLPLGSFTDKQQRIIAVTAGFLQAFYGLPVEKLPPRPLNAAYPNARENTLTHTRQTKTSYIINDVVAPLLPSDAAALLAFTATDVYLDESTNFLFGQASFDKRVGVWSLYRLSERADYGKFLRRTLKIAAHETGHMFSMLHCTIYECLMSGTNYLGETDRRPLDVCPECMAKIAWLSKVDPEARYLSLAAFCRANGLQAEAREFDQKAAAVLSQK